MNKSPEHFIHILMCYDLARFHVMVEREQISIGASEQLTQDQKKELTVSIIHHIGRMNILFLDKVTP